MLVTGLWSDVVANDDDDGDNSNSNGNSNSNTIAIVYATRLSFKAIRCRYSIEWFIALLVNYTMKIQKVTGLYVRPAICGDNVFHMQVLFIWIIRNPL